MSFLRILPQKHVRSNFGTVISRILAYPIYSFLLARGYYSLLQNSNRIRQEFIMISLPFKRWPFGRKAVDNSLPSYTDIYPSASPQAHTDVSVHRLQTFITWRLAIDYRLTSSIPKPNRPNESEYAYFASLSRRYCMILAQRNETGEEMIAARQQLQEDVFDPALTLGMPADIAELFLFSTRIFIKRCRKNTYMGRWSAKRHTMAVMSRCAVDYNVIITSVVTDPSLACEMMAKCLKLHSYSFRCFLSPKYYTLPDLNMELLPSYMTETPSRWPNVLEILKQAHRTPAESKNDKTLRIDFAEFKQWTPRFSDGIRPGVVLAEDDDKLAKWENRLPQWAQLHRGLMANPEFSYKDVAPGDGLAPGNLTLKERQEVERKIQARTLGKSPKNHGSAIKDELCVD